MLAQNNQGTVGPLTVVNAHIIKRSSLCGRANLSGQANEFLLY